MGEICPACNKGELKELVAGIRQCTVCRKVFKGETKIKKEEKFEDEIIEGEVFMRDTSLNPKWEIAEKGITIEKDPNKSWLAVLLCHSPNFSNSKYIRISWWKKSINEHAGMFKIDEIDEVENVILALERFDTDFDEQFEPKHAINSDPIPERAKTNINSTFDEKNKLCPNCHWKMKISKNHHYYSCEHCGDIVVIEDGHPIQNILNSQLPIAYNQNYPVNFYLPSYGITTKNLMAEWKAIIIVYAKENPDKKWLRFYWWQRDLQNYMMTEYSFGIGKDLKWDARKGTLSPNIYEKKHIRPIINALRKLKAIWSESLPKETMEEKPLIIKNSTKKSELSKKKSTKKNVKIDLPE